MPRAVAWIVLSILVSCKGPMSKIEAERDALASGDMPAIDAATTGFAKCSDLPLAQLRDAKNGMYDEACLSVIANGFGSQKGFVANPADHAGAATAALVLVRDGRGDGLSHVDGWLLDLRNGKGAGFDALRLAVARNMAQAAPTVGKKLADDDSQKAALKAIVSAIPGACPTYELVAKGVDAQTIPPELTPDHSACVQHDLARREGPGGTYGTGQARALEGALAVWRETERALRQGSANADPHAKATIESKLSIIEPATLKIETTRAPSTAPDMATLSALGEAHAEAGVRIMRPASDAGAR